MFNIRPCYYTAVFLIDQSYNDNIYIIVIRIYLPLLIFFNRLFCTLWYFNPFFVHIVHLFVVSDIFERTFQLKEDNDIFVSF